MGLQVFLVSSKSDPPWQFRIWLDKILTAVTEKENFQTELCSADQNKVLRDTPTRPEISMNGEDAREKQARLLRDNVERVELLQDNEKKLEAKKRTQHLLQRGAENIRAMTILDKLRCGGIKKKFKDIVIMVKCFFQKSKKSDSRKVKTIHAL